VRSLEAIAITAALTVAPPAARAEAPSPALGWGVLTGELAIAGVFYGHFGANALPTRGPGMIVNFTPMVLGGVGAYAGYALDLDPRPAFAVHGAGWMGLNLFLVGSLIDGRDRRWGVRAGPAAWTLGALGSIAGGVIGATAVDGRDESMYWMAAPGMGFMAGGLGLGGLLILIGGVEGDHAMGQLALGAACGFGVGLGVATYLAYRGVGDTAPGSATPRTGDAGRGRFVLSWGGAF
jgi:hypothetical protein